MGPSLYYKSKDNYSTWGCSMGFVQVSTLLKQNVVEEAATQFLAKW